MPETSESWASTLRPSPRRSTDHRLRVVPCSSRRARAAVLGVEDLGGDSGDSSPPRPNVGCRASPTVSGLSPGRDSGDSSLPGGLWGGTGILRRAGGPPGYCLVLGPAAAWTPFRLKGAAESALPVNVTPASVAGAPVGSSVATGVMASRRLSTVGFIFCASPGQFVLLEPCALKITDVPYTPLLRPGNVRSTVR